MKLIICFLICFHILSGNEKDTKNSSELELFLFKVGFESLLYDVDISKNKSNLNEKESSKLNSKIEIIMNELYKEKKVLIDNDNLNIITEKEKNLKDEVSNLKDEVDFLKEQLRKLTSEPKSKPIIKVMKIKNTPKEKIEKETKKVSKYYLDIKRINKYINIPGVNNTKDELLKALNNTSNKNEIAKINFNLGILYLLTNKKTNQKKSRDYFEQSGLKEAYFNLGVFYYIGLYVKENDNTAYKYFTKSSNLGFLRGKNNRLIMEEYNVGIH